MPLSSQGYDCLDLRDDCIIVGNSIKEIDEFIKSLQGGSEDFILTDEGNIDKFLGVEIVDRGRGEFEMKQPYSYLIDRILEKLGLKDNSLNATSTRGKLQRIQCCSIETSMGSRARRSGITDKLSAC